MDEIGKIFSTRSENWAISKMLVGVFREVLGQLGGFKKKKKQTQELTVFWIELTHVMLRWQAFFPSC
jgi:hypothetical protein